MVRFHWCSDQQTFLARAKGFADAISTVDAPISAQSHVTGHCPICRRPASFRVSTGAAFSGRPNLREGLRCTRCGLTARQRLMLVAMEQQLAAAPARSGAMLEKTSRLYRRARARWPWLIGSEYLGENRAGGQHYWWSARGLRWRRLRHESITALSYPGASLDLLAHSDVLEHVYDLDRALQEASRVLRPGGVMLFTVPFFADRPHSLLRGKPRSDGSIDHLEPPEYHGDGVRQGGIYTFHSLGWDFVARMRAAGFTQVEVGLCHAPDEGLASADPFDPHPWLGVPTVFRAIR